MRPSVAALTAGVADSTAPASGTAVPVAAARAMSGAALLDEHMRQVGRDEKRERSGAASSSERLRPAGPSRGRAAIGGPA